MSENCWMEPQQAACGPQASAALLPFPRLLQVEVTTRCNMRCAMCVKSAPGSDIVEAHLPMELFEKLAPALEYCDKLVLNGIGEPLLHPRLPEMAVFARERMPADGEIGFQTNGLLLTSELAGRLVRAGVDTVCISVDAVDAPQGQEPGQGELHGQNKVHRLERAFALLRTAAQENDRRLRLGVEFVLMADTAEQLPKVVRWAAQQGASFVIVSHVLAYNHGLHTQSLFNPNTPKATALFQKWQAKARREGLDLHDYLSSLWKYGKSGPEKRIAELAEGLQEEARQRQIWLHLRSLLDWDRRDVSALHALCDEAQDSARALQVELRMPPLMALDQRRCHFIADAAALVTATGDVCPCQFLWHGATCHLDGDEKHIQPWRFGNLNDTPFAAAWRSEAYAVFRQEVLQDAYPYCSNCPFVPCEDISCKSYAFEYDCLGSKVPCGHCLWNMGALQCLL